jgi:hypothetical protein
MGCKWLWSCLCLLDHLNLETSDKTERRLIINRVIFLQWILTLSVIIVSGVLIVATDFWLKTALGMTSSVLEWHSRDSAWPS